MPPNHQQQRRLIKYFAKSIKRHPDWPVLISEGDSWFSYPLRPNVINVLDTRAQRRISLLRLERSGEELLTILSGKQKDKLRRQLKRYPVQALLLSGGGNDIVDRNLLPLLREKEPASRTWESCIKKGRVKSRLLQLKLAYQELIDIRDDVNEDCMIYTHGYDHAIPTGKGVKIGPIKLGPWLKPYLDRRKINDPMDQRNVIRWLIDSFNEMQIGLAAANPKVVFVDCRGTLGENDWHNELHPHAAGFRSVGALFSAKLDTQFPGVFA
jgi:hypothetical protein